MSNAEAEFDENLFVLKLSVIARQMEVETVAARRLNGSVTQRVDAELEVLRKHLDRVDQACREVWQAQGRPLTSEFVREVVAPKIVLTIAARSGTIKANFALEARRTRTDASLPLRLRLLAKAIREIKSTTGNRYEIEARELGYRKPGGTVVRALENVRLDPSNTGKPTATRMTRCPPPAKYLSGTGGWNPRPNPTQIPANLPPLYPDVLRVPTHLIMAEAVRLFTDQKHSLELCKYVISEVTPLIREGVRRGTIRPESVFAESVIEGLVHYLLVYNCDRDEERYRIAQEVRRSDEWLKLARAVAEAHLKPPKATPPEPRSRLRATVSSPLAARRMERFLESKGIGQTDFASRVGTTDRTLRAFRQSGKVRRDILEAIAKGMGLTREELLKPE